jgi:hypothetical protein
MTPLRSTNGSTLAWSSMRPSRPRSACSCADRHYRQIARPFDWTFTRADLERVLAKITEREPRLALAA